MRKSSSKHQRTLSVKQRKFCEAYVRNNGNGVQAAREAGYKGNDNTLGAVASENLRKPNVKEFLKQMAQDAQDSQPGTLLTVVSEREALLRTSILARASLDDVLDERGRFDLAKARRTLGIYAIRRLTFYRSGRVKSVELRDKNASLELMGRHLGLWTGEITDWDALLARLANTQPHLLPSSLSAPPGDTKE